MNNAPSQSVDHDDQREASDYSGVESYVPGNASAPGSTDRPNMQDRNKSPFVRATLQSIPAWQRIVGAAPWWDVATNARRVIHRPVLDLFRQQASILGLSIALRIDSARHDAERIRACIRAGLIHWQAALDPEGRPVAVRRRGSRLWPVVTQQVLRTVNEVGLAHCAELPQDLGAHLDWLRKRDYEDASWIEAALVESLASGALVTRDTNLHRLARERLPGLLHRQSEEGWFRERGGADVGRLTLTLDALARLYFDYDWGELFEPLQRAVRFLHLFVHTNGTGGGCYNSCDTAFVSPYALRRLSVRLPQAARITRCLRDRLESNLADVPTGWHDNVTAVLGSAIAATAACADESSSNKTPNDRQTVSQSGEPPLDDTGDPPREKHLAESGLTWLHRKAYDAIVAGRRGGAAQVRWFAPDRVVEYPGIMVLFAHAVRTSRAQGAGYPGAAENGSMSWRGILLKAGPRKTPWWQGVWTATLGRLWRRRSGSVATRFKTDTSRGRHRVLHDWFAREVIFDDQTVTFRDQILTRLPPDAVVFESSIGEDRWADHCGNNALRDAPIVIEGGRALTITRVYRNAVLESIRVERQADFF